LNETLEDRGEQRTRQVRSLISQLTLSEQAERRRTSQILHDDLQQHLYGLQFQFILLGNLLEEGDTGSALTAIQKKGEDLKRAIQMTRSLSVDLSPPVLYHEGLAEVVRWLATQMKQQHQLTVGCYRVAIGLALI
jgi:signal transduction histidine kinase